MIGLVEDVRRVVQPGFKHDGDLIALLGSTDDDLSISEYAATIEGLSTEDDDRRGHGAEDRSTDSKSPCRLSCLEAAEAGLLRSAHDCSDGGLAVALAECCFSLYSKLAPSIWRRMFHRLMNSASCQPRSSANRHHGLSLVSRNVSRAPVEGNCRT